jgi:hypothetical protein
MKNGIPTDEELECITTDPFFLPYEDADTAEGILLSALHNLTPETFDYLFHICCRRLYGFTGRGYSVFQNEIFKEYLRRVSIRQRRAEKATKALASLREEERKLRFAQECGVYFKKKEGMKNGI